MAFKAAGTDETKAVAAPMRERKINDPTTENGWIREDGRVMRGFPLAQVKTPAESKGRWDDCKILSAIPAERAAMPLSRGTCAQVKKG